MQEILNSKITVSYLISLLASVIKNDCPPSAPFDLNFEDLYKLASQHSVANIAYYGLAKLDPIPPSEFLNHFKSSCYAAILQETQQEAEVGKLILAFEEQQIKYMPLKGYIIKHLYPEPDMRTMGDIDILVDETQLKKARDIMLALNYTEGPPQSYHDVYYKNNVNIELHHALVSKKAAALYAYFGTGWERARLKLGSSFEYEMSLEDDYIYMIGHMAKHYQTTGLGIRYILDVWVYKRYYMNQINWNYIDNELKRAGLYDFNKRMEALSEYWFDGNSSNIFSKEIAEFVLSNTTHGSRNNKTLNILLKGKGNKSVKWLKFKYILWVLFPDMKTMAEKFPLVQKFPFVLPIFWIYRGIETLSTNRSLIKFNLDEISSLTDLEAEKMKQVQSKSGF